MRAAAPRNSILHDALDAAHRGWRVFPCWWATGGRCACPEGVACKSQAKHPLILAWPETATTDAGIITGWWGRWPAANVGIATGTVSSLLVLDVDPRHGGDEACTSW